MNEVHDFLKYILKQCDKKIWYDRDIKRFYNKFLDILKDLDINEKDALDTGAHYIGYNKDYDFSSNIDVKEYIIRIFDCMESLKTYQMFLIIGVILKVNSNKDNLLNYNAIKKEENNK